MSSRSIASTPLQMAEKTASDDNRIATKPKENEVTADMSGTPSITATYIADLNGLQRQLNINFYAKDSPISVNVESNNSYTTVVGDGSQVNIIQQRCNCACSQNIPVSNQSERPRTEIPKLDSLCIADSDSEDEQSVKPRQKRRQKKRNKVAVKAACITDSNPQSPQTCASKQQTAGTCYSSWRFETILSDFVDLNAVESNILQWVRNLTSDLLCGAPDLENGEVKTFLEEAKQLLDVNFEKGVKKLLDSVRLMITEKEKFSPLISEIMFVLAEFYSCKEDYKSALQVLKKLENGEHCADSEKARLYAKIGKIIADGRYATSGADDDCEESLVLWGDTTENYFEKALTWSKHEPFTQESLRIQRFCHLGMAGILVNLNDTLPNSKEPRVKTTDLQEARRNLELMEAKFDGVTPSIKCQFYLVEAYLHYHQRDFAMTRSRASDAKVLTQENGFSKERECVGCKKLSAVLKELPKSRESDLELQDSDDEEPSADDEISIGSNTLGEFLNESSDD